MYYWSLPWAIISNSFIYSSSPSPNSAKATSLLMGKNPFTEVCSNFTSSPVFNSTIKKFSSYEYLSTHESLFLSSYFFIYSTLYYLRYNPAFKTRSVPHLANSGTFLEIGSTLETVGAPQRKPPDILYVWWFSYPCNSAMTTFFILRSFSHAPGVSMMSSIFSGLICHERPYLSLHQPQTLSCPPFLVRASQ